MTLLSNHNIPERNNRALVFAVLVVFLVLSNIFLTHAVAQEKQRVTIALLSDISPSDNNGIRERQIGELKTLTQAEFDLKFVDFKIDWASNDFDQQLNRIYRKPNIDMLLVLGVAANQIVVRRENFPKPTFLPFVVERELASAPFKKRNGLPSSSGKKNLSYLTYSTEFVDAIDQLREVVPFQNIAILADEVLFKVLPPELAEEANRDNNVRLQLVPHNGTDHDLMARIPSDADAVMFGYLPRFPEAQLSELISQLTARGLPSFSYLEEGLIERGLLATPLNDSVYQFAARKNALNMQAVMLGEPASLQPVQLQTKRKLTINESTARKLGIAIAFKVLVDADVRNFGVRSENDRLDLFELVDEALKQNLNLRDSRLSLDLQDNEQSIAKSALRPRLAASASYLRRKEDSGLVQSGFASEESTDAVVQLSQTLFSDSQSANYKIQNLLTDASRAEYRQAELDIIREAALAMADVLQAQSVAAIQQENLAFSEKNLDLAIDRVSIGVTSSADQYRWETQVSNAKSAVFESFSQVLIAKQNLNRVINRDIVAPLEVVPVDMNTSMIYSTEELFKLMDNTDTFESLYFLGLSKAYQDTPEIKRLDSIIQAKQRELKTIARSNWLPELSLNGQVSENLDNSSAQASGSDGRDWQLMLNARIPFYQGGEIKAKKKRSKLELEQLQNQLALLKQRLAQSLRASMNNVVTSLFTLEFSSNAALAASRSLSLVTDAYSKGAVQVVDLLDAQNASISSNLAEVQASIGYFRANIEMQRTIGTFEFLMSDQQKQDIRQQIKATVK